MHEPRADHIYIALSSANFIFLLTMASLINQDRGLPELCEIPPYRLEIEQTQISGKQQEHRVTDFICYPHK